jgi:hypothetical protein
MDNPMSAATKSLPSVLQVFWHPMLLLAVGLHGIFLFIPLGKGQKQLPEVTEQPVSYNRLPDIKPNPPKSVPKPTVKKSPTTSQKTAASPPPLTTPNPSPATPYKPPATTPPDPANATDTPDNDSLVRLGSKPAAENTTTPLPPSNSVSPETPTTPTTTATANLRPDLDSETRELIERLGDLNGRPIGQDEDLTAIIPSETISNFFTNLEKKESKPGLVGVEYLSQQKLEEVYEYLTLIYPDYTLKKVGEYGGGTVYEIKKGDYVRYFNLVKAKEEKGTLIVLWKESPV